VRVSRTATAPRIAAARRRDAAAPILCLNLHIRIKIGVRFADVRSARCCSFSVIAGLTWPKRHRNPPQVTHARAGISPSSLALSNLRAAVILIVLAFHSCIAYLDFLPSSAQPFNSPPYQWRSFPIVDTQRWLGFDLFCAPQDVYLMSLMFFLSGVFVWPSLARKGSWRYARHRVLRLGLPFALAVFLLMPVALYPVYLVTGADPAVAAFWHSYLALPFWPSDHGSCGNCWC
jgi:hypothetical protein